MGYNAAVDSTLPPDEPRDQEERPADPFRPAASRYPRDVLAPPPAAFEQPQQTTFSEQPSPQVDTPPPAPLPTAQQTPPSPPQPHVWLQPMQPVLPGAVRSDGMWFAPAGLWPRVGAFLIDMIILGLLSSILVWIAGIPEPDMERGLRVLRDVFATVLAGGMPSEAMLVELRELQRPAQVAGWLNIAMCGSYFTLLHGLAATTLGKLCFGLTIMRRDGNAVGVWLALWRYLLYLVCAKLVYTAWLIPLNAERRTLYDILSSTNVYRQVRG